RLRHGEGLPAAGPGLHRDLVHERGGRGERGPALPGDPDPGPPVEGDHGVIAQALKPPSMWQWIGDHTGQILTRLGQHVELTVIAVAVGLAISLPLSILA